MTPQTKDRLLVNLELLPKRASAWAYTAGGLLLATFLGLTESQRQAVYDALHVPPALYPVIALLVGLIAQVWPQKATAPEVVVDKLADKAIKREEAESALDPLKPTNADTPQ